MKNENTDSHAPSSPAHKRPGNKPYYIDHHCPDCGAELALVDLLEDPNTAENDIWNDEFTCPVCRDSVFMDWPEETYEEVSKNPDQELIYMEDD